MKFFRQKNKKELYIRLAKTGSTSLTSIIPPSTLELTPTTENIQKFKNHTFDYKFTFVRNPFDRLVSSYFMMCKSKIGRDLLQALREDFHESVSFQEYVDKVYSYREHYRQYDLDKRQNVFIMPWFHENRDPDLNRVSYEVYWILSHTQGLVEGIEFLIPLESLDFIGRYENFQEDFKNIRGHLKIKKALPHLNVRKQERKPFQTYYDDSTKNLVSEIYDEDLRRLNYSF